MNLKRLMTAPGRAVPRARLSLRIPGCGEMSRGGATGDAQPSHPGTIGPPPPPYAGLIPEMGNTARFLTPQIRNFRFRSEATLITTPYREWCFNTRRAPQRCSGLERPHGSLSHLSGVYRKLLAVGGSSPLPSRWDPWRRRGCLSIPSCPARKGAVLSPEGEAAA